MEKQARIEASLRERERTVQRFRSEQTKEIDREREQHKREEAVQHFKALMSDMVRRVCNRWLKITANYLDRCKMLRHTPCVTVHSSVFYTFPDLQTWICYSHQLTDDILHQLIINAFMNQVSQTPVSCFHIWFSSFSSPLRELNQLFESRHKVPFRSVSITLMT